MKVVNRKEFLAMPAGTLYTEYEPCVATGLAIKHNTIDNGGSGDWFYTSLIASSESCEGLSELYDGKEVLYSSNWEGRDGEFNQDQQFIVYSPEDVFKFAESLANLINARVGWEIKA